MSRAARIAEIRAGVQERLARQAILDGTPVPPRYDEVYAAGVEWLDSLAGEPISEVSIGLEIDREPDSD
ncbi:MAG: hypothetical protein H0X67_04245 [Acidobacteria bacterium]|nr:hypothetical protein [Acidobacteriota bacterium]